MITNTEIEIIQTMVTPGEMILVALWIAVPSFGLGCWLVMYFLHKDSRRSLQGGMKQAGGEICNLKDRVEQLKKQLQDAKEL